jgi:ATP-dependent exoDNAse (exonuclease V) beta subunit
MTPPFEPPVNKTHISYSELSDWDKCPYYRKKAWDDKVVPYEVTEHTAFGRAIHTACEKKLVDDSENAPEIFELEFHRIVQEELISKNIDYGKENVEMMKKAGPAILLEVGAALKSYFGNYEVFKTELRMREQIEEMDFYFKGFVDAIIKVGDVYHLFDWKTCSWGWDSKKKSDKITTYQLTLYKHFFCQKYKIDPSKVETHFALLKKTAKKDRVEFFRVTSGKRKIENALKLLYQAIYNIKKGPAVKNRLNCKQPFECKLYKTPHCR